eukprot:11050493-Heterocapsa_arctica.AAC.1
MVWHCLHHFVQAYPFCPAGMSVPGLLPMASSAPVSWGAGVELEEGVGSAAVDWSFSRVLVG